MNTKQKQKWQTSTALSFWGVVIKNSFSTLSILIILYVFYNLSDIILDGIQYSIYSLNLDYYEDTFSGFAGAAAICWVISLLGWLAYLVGICIFKGAQTLPDSEMRTRNVMIIELLMPGLLILTFVLLIAFRDSIDGKIIIFTDIAGWLVSLVAVIYLMIQFNALSKDESWAEKSRHGASNLKLSYSFMLWIQAAIIVGIGMIGLTVLSFKSKVEALQFDAGGLYEAYGQINSTVELAQNFAGTIKVESIFICLTIFVFTVLMTVYRIMGWRRIQCGGDENVFVRRTSSYGSQPYTGPGRFCHKCGMELPAESAFCPGCGSPVATTTSSLVVTDATEAIHLEENDSTKNEAYCNEDSVSVDDSEPYEEETDSKRKWMLWGGIALGVILLGGAIWAFVGGSKYDPNARIFVNQTVAFKTVEDGVGIEPICELEYGTEVEDLSDKSHDDTWTEIRFEHKGKVLKGFVDKTDLAHPLDFAILDAVGFYNKNTRELLNGRTERLAILHAANSLDGEWIMDVTDEGDPNAIFLTVKGVSPSEDCFAFCLKELVGDGRRAALVYSTPDIFQPDNRREPVWLFTEYIKEEDGKIKDVTYNKKKQTYNISFFNSYQDAHDSYEISEDPASDYFSIYDPVSLKGTIDGKYDIILNFRASAYDDHMTGDYRYTKYNDSIRLAGSFSSNANGIFNLTLEEYANDSHSGTFIGIYDGSKFSGRWISADGEREMPFDLEKY